MKKSAKHNKLAFNKANIIELSDKQSDTINGGGSYLLSIIVITAGYGTWLGVL